MSEQPVLALGGGLGTKEPDAEGGHPGPPPLPGLRTPGSTRHACLTSLPNHPAQLCPHTFQFVCFNWGLPILEAGKLRLHQEGGARGADPHPAQPLSVFNASREDEAKGQRIEVRRSRPLGSGFPSWPLPAPGEWTGRELPGEAPVSGETKVPRVQRLLSRGGKGRRGRSQGSTLESPLKEERPCVLGSGVPQVPQPPKVTYLHTKRSWTHTFALELMSPTPTS